MSKYLAETTILEKTFKDIAGIIFIQRLGGNTDIGSYHMFQNVDKGITVFKIKTKCKRYSILSIVKNNGKYNEIRLLFNGMTVMQLSQKGKSCYLRNAMSVLHNDDYLELIEVTRLHLINLVNIG